MKKPDFHAEFIEACMLASGYANMCGYHAAARQIAEYATCDKKALTAASNCDTIKSTAQKGGKQEGKTMKTYTRHEYNGYDIYISDDTNRVHHAVKIDTANPTTLYPYEPCKTGGLDNACEFYTLQQVKNRMKTGKIVFR